MTKTHKRRGRPPGRKNGTGKSSKFSKGKGRPRQRELQPNQDQQPVLPWPSLRRVDMEVLPRMSSLATNPDEEAGDREDLNSLQLELETLLSAAAVRRRQLEEQIIALKSCEKKGSRPRLAPRPSTPTPTLPPEPPSAVIPLPPPPDPDRHRGLPRGRHNLKKTRDVRSSDSSTRAVKPCGRKHLERNLAPHKFWMAVEPYSTEPDEENLLLIQDLIHHNENVVPKLLEETPLGEHYTSRWDFSDDVKCHADASSGGSQSEETESKVSTEDTNADTSSSQGNNFSSSIGNVVKRKLRECTASIKRSIRGSLDKKFLAGQSPSKLASLLQGNSNDVKVANSELTVVKTEEEDSVPAKISRTDSKYLSDIHTSACIERRQRLKMEAAGELPIGPNIEKTSDTVLEELRRAQEELRILAAHNNQELMRMASHLQRELSRQKLISRLKRANDAVVNIYQARNTGKLNKLVPTPEETTEAWRALSIRNEILRHLDYLDRSWCSGNIPPTTHNNVLAPAS